MSRRVGASVVPGAATRRAAASAVLGALVLSACQLQLAVDVGIDRGGGGRVELAAHLDPELADLLADVGADPLDGLEGLAAAAPGWEVEGRRDDQGGVSVRFESTFADPAEFEALTRDLQAALDEDDPRLYEDLRLDRSDDGSVTFAGRVGLLLPAAPGARGVGVGFDADDLERLLDERGDEFVRYDVRVALPAPPARHDADEVDGASLTWRAPVGELRAVEARSRPPGGPSPVLLVAVAVIAALVAGSAVVWLRGRGWGPRRASAGGGPNP